MHTCTQVYKRSLINGERQGSFSVQILPVSHSPQTMLQLKVSF